MTFTDNGNGTATLAGTPTTGGSYPLSLTANNGVNPNATQTLTLTVGQPPALTSANTTTFTTGTAGSFTVTTTPTAYPTPTITSTGTLPGGVTLADNGDGTATLAGTPAAGTGGAYPLSLTASNGVNPNGSQTLTVTVAQPPAVTASPSGQTVNAGASVSFVAAASGYPTPTPQWQRSTDGGTTYAPIAGATNATYTFTATSTDNGNRYRAVFTNSAGSATSTGATLNVNTQPTISSPNTTSFTAGTPATFTVTTSGYPNPTLSTTGTLPAWLGFTDNSDGTATLAGTPPVGSAGQYGLTITADNGIAPAANQPFTLSVNEPPTITSADHAGFQVGTAGNFAVTTAAGFPVATTVSATGTLPAGVTFTPDGSGGATLAGTPAAGSAGTYPITITAGNGATTPTTQAFTLTITDSPVITSIDHATFVVGSAATFAVTTTGGGAGTAVSYTGALPAGVTFTPSGTGATLAGTPATGTGGAYPITITASDGVTPDDSQTFTLTVNQPPTITSADHDSLTFGAAHAFTVTTAPGTPTATTLTQTGALPSGVSFTDNGDGTATLGGTPSATGSFPITITATNGVAPAATQTFTVTVNRPPALTSADHTTFAFGTPGSFTITTAAGYPAATTVAMTGTPPPGVALTDNGDGTATLAGTPTAAGSFPLTLTAGNAATTDATQPFTLTVTKKPVVTSGNATAFTASTPSAFTVTTAAGYPTPTTLTETGALPVGVTFADNGDGTATLSGTPTLGAFGAYPITLTAANSAGSNQQAFTLTVQPPNAPPSITSADHATFTKGSPGSFTITTTPGYPTTTTISKTGALPAGLAFADNHDGTATVAGTPTSTGPYAITVTAGNGATADTTQTLTITVNAPPAITSANLATLVSDLSGQAFTVTTSPGYPTATTLTETGALPNGTTFTDNHDGTATIAGTPSVPASASFPIVVTASNGTSPDATQSLTLQITKVAAVPLPMLLPKPTGSLGGVPAKTYVGTILAITGSGYRPGAPIDIGWYYSNSTGTKLTALAHCYTDANGTFSTPVRVLNNTGSKTFAATGLGSNGKARYLEAATVVNPPTRPALFKRRWLL